MIYSGLLRILGIPDRIGEKVENRKEKKIYKKWKLKAIKTTPAW